MHLLIEASNLRRGGGVTHLQEILATQAYARYGIKKITLWAPKATLEQIGDLPGIVRKSHPLINRGRWQGIWFRKWYLNGLIDEDVDLLWAPGGTYLGSFRPYVTMLRNFLPFVEKERNRFKYTIDWLRLVYLSQAQAKSFKSADGLIHISNTAQQILNELLDVEHVQQSVIYHGLSTRFRMAPREQLPIESFTAARPVRLLYVSHINLYKHQDKLVEAVARVRAKGIPIELNLVGPVLAKAKRQFDRVCRKFDPEKEWVRWHGEIPYSQVQRFYHDSDLCAYMSSCETFGNILLEAMASGLPILCSNQSALPEIQGGTCPEVDPEDVDAVAAGLEQMLRDKALRERCAQAAYERAQSFTWEKCADATFKFLAECAKR